MSYRKRTHIPSEIAVTIPKSQINEDDEIISEHTSVRLGIQEKLEANNQIIWNEIGEHDISLEHAEEIKEKYSDIEDKRAIFYHQRVLAKVKRTVGIYAIELTTCDSFGKTYHYRYTEDGWENNDKPSDIELVEQIEEEFKELKSK